MSRRKYLYRVTAYRDKTNGDRGEWAETRCYQTKEAALHRAGVWREGRPEVDELDHYEPAGEPANRVTIERSAPVDGWETFGVPS